MFLLKSMHITINKLRISEQQSIQVLQVQIITFHYMIIIITNITQIPIPFLPDDFQKAYGVCLLGISLARAALTSSIYESIIKPDTTDNSLGNHVEGIITKLNSCAVGNIYIMTLLYFDSIMSQCEYRQSYHPQQKSQSVQQDL